METAPCSDRICLYQAFQLDAVLDRMARQAAGLLASRRRCMLVGILRRGAPLAAFLHQRLLLQPHMPELGLMNLRVQRYADDLTLLHPDTRLTETPDQRDLDLRDTIVLIVDDVLYQGHSLLRTVDYLVQKGAAEIHTAVLVDRGASKLPVHAEIVGLRLDIAPGGIIECHVPPYESDFRIELVQAAPGRSAPGKE